ncbi:MAG: prephenate dehydrogenase/arogenate dehydrogenase family protein [Spirochaetaceae bacterium]|nr:MAG: prephenate dehydrogenase/arogenate dehydrogenase family protein [Spirochaetaceae bacterium]
MQTGVIGLGRFGAFWATLLARQFPVLGYNRSPNRPIPNGIQTAGLAEVCACDALFLCVSISAIDAVATEIAGLVSSHTVVIDTCSVKEYPLRLLRERLHPHTSIIGTHPMFGPDSARDGVKGLPLILCRERADESVVQYWAEAFRGFGLQVMEMSAEEHDREAAYTQGITHFVGRVLRELDVKPSAIATLGYQKILEVVEQTCNDPMQLFVDLQRHNRFTANMRRDLTAAFGRVVEKLGPSGAPSAPRDGNASPHDHPY